MGTDVPYYGGVIPAAFVATWYDAVTVWADENMDNQLARAVMHVEPVDKLVEEYEIVKIDYDAADVVPQAKKTPGVEVSIGGSGDSAKIWRWPDYFTINEDDLNKSPSLQNQYVAACMTHIFRGEDKVFVNGRAANNITGLVATARANPNGKMVATGGDDSATFDNVGSWQAADTNRDIYEDLRISRGFLASRFRSKLDQLYLVGHSDDIDCLDQKDPYSDNSSIIAESVCRLFGRSVTDPVGSWAIRNDQITEGYVYIVAKSREAAELVQARSITIDDNYPRTPIGNLQVHLYHDVGFAFHNAEAFVEIQVT